MNWLLPAALVFCSTGCTWAPEVSCDPGGPGTTVTYQGEQHTGDSTNAGDAFMQPLGLHHFAVRDDCAFLVRTEHTNLTGWERTRVGYSDQQTLRDLLRPVRNAPRSRHGSGLYLSNEDRAVSWPTMGRAFRGFAIELAALGEIAEPDAIHVAAFLAQHPEEPAIDWPFTSVAPRRNPQVLGPEDHAVALALWPETSVDLPRVIIDGEVVDLGMRDEVDLLALP